MKKRKQEEIEYGFTAFCGNGIRSLFAVEFLLHGLLLLLESEFPEWQMGTAWFLRMQLVLVPVLLFFELLAGAKRRILRTGKIMAGIFIPAGCGFYVLFNKNDLMEGLFQAYNEYIKYWNSYYKTNYRFFDTEGEQRELFLAVTVCIVFLICVSLRYLTEIRLFLILPVFLTLALGLLVNCLPQWRGLAECFVGVIFLFSAPWGKEKIVFHQCSGKKESQSLRIGAQFVTIVLVLMLGMLIVTCTPRFLGKEAEKIPQNSNIFIEFQQQAEEKLAGISLPVFSQDKAVLDNRTPKYTGKEILEIHASESPVTNLYLKDFYSGSYVDGKWEETDDFEKEASSAGYTPEHLGSLLHQQYFEKNRDQGDDQNGDTPWVLDYTINYTGGRTGFALVPYFSDLSGNKDAVWVEGDGVVHKKKGKKKLNFQGLSRNTFFQGELYDTPDPEGENAGLDWYGEYVKQKNLGGSEEIPALKQYVSEIKETYGVSAVSVMDYDNWDWVAFAAQSMLDKDDEYNYNRLAAAAAVRSILSNKASYNLYLDDIPAGCDTIQYFLETGHEGYCMHFASAGVLLLQEMGVPARYASGYIVKASSFQKEDGQYTAKVLDRNAHAWAEIYLEGYGWIPYEMTPGYQDVMSSLPTDEEHRDYLKRQHEEKSVQKETQTQETQVQKPAETQSSETQEKETQEKETQTAESTQPGLSLKNESKTGGKPVKILLIVLVLLFMAALPVWHLKKEREKLEHEIRCKKYRRAVCRMNRRIYKRLWNHAPEVLHLPMKKQGSSKVHLSYLTDEEYLQRLIQTYPAVSPGDWKQYMEIVQKAAFSREEITKEEMRFCYKIYHKY